MALTYGFYNSISGDRKYNAKQMSTLFDGIIRDGVFATVGQSLMISAGSDMTINVGTGRAWFNGTWTNNDAPLPLVVPPSEAVLNRIDVVVLEVNDTNDVRANSIKILKGAPATIPTNPTLTNNELVHQYPLAYIYVGANVSSIIQANITNKIGTASTPFVTGILQIVAVDMLIAQWESEFDTWLDRIKDLFGDDPAGNLQNQVDHLGDQIDELGAYAGAYAIAGGTNSYTVTINGYTLTEGKTIRIKFTNANTGASTLNINSFGAKSIIKGNGNALSSGNIKAGQICNLVYTGSVFQLLGEGGEYGTAVAGDVLSGKTIGTENGVINGTLVNRGTVNQTLTTQGSSYTIPSGKHSGSGKVIASFSNLSAGNIKKGVNIGGIIGTYPTYPMLTLTESGTLVIPLFGVTSVTAYLIGGGTGGQSGGHNGGLGGAGGDSGKLYTVTFPVSPGEEIPYTVGSGGAGGKKSGGSSPSNVPGGVGTPSIIKGHSSNSGSILALSAGRGPNIAYNGRSVNITTPSGAITQLHSGGQGGNSYNTPRGTSPGGGNGAIGKSSGTGNNGDNATMYGSGGGGGAGVDSTNPSYRGDGGNGANGVIYVIFN